MKKHAVLVLLLSIGLVFFSVSANARPHQRKEISVVSKSQKHANPVVLIDTSSHNRKDTRSFVTTASWYKQGKVTANGEKFDPSALTAAHKTLPFGTIVKITNPTNEKQIFVRINDRGPFKRNREFDLSMNAAQLLGFKQKGVVKIVVEIMDKELKNASTKG